MLQELHDGGFILRYASNGGAFIQIVNFAKHQNPHHREAESAIPAPGLPETSPGLFPGLPIAGTGQGEYQPGCSPEPAVLIPDSLNLIPDSPIPSSAAGAAVVAGKPDEPCPHDEIIELYHRLLPTGRQVRIWNNARRAKLRSRWREDAQRQSLGWWERFFGYVAESAFLTGRTTARNGRTPFELDLEWIVSPANFVKIIEGKYHEAADSREAAA